jgi:hypothetical protein
MNNLRSLSLAIIMLSSSAYYATAQDVSDALRYSYLTPQGTARSIGIGGAEGSVGGDFTSLSINPAGIGIYRSSEFTVTPSVKANGVNGQYLNNSTGTNNTQFNFNNVGMVFTAARKGQRYAHSKWKTVSFGIGITRMADFNTDYNYSGSNYTSSATQSYAADATTNRDVEQPGTPGYLGYQAYLTNYDSAANKYTSIVDPTKGVTQQRIVNQSGGINEVELALGGNYMEKLMLGATLGVPIINYNRTVQYSETAMPGAGGDFAGYNYNENLTTNGIGVNLKLGAIYKFSDYFRIGAAIHSPTYYSMHDEDNTNINSEVAGVGSTYVPTNFNHFDYNMTTPWRGVLSAAGFLGKYGFITADYEYVDYSSTRFHYGGDYLDAETAVNQEIKSTLKGASNIRIGVEGRVTSIFSLRAGFDYYGNPYNSSGADGNVDGSSIAFTGGLGFRFTHWFIDAGFIHTQYKNGEQPYSDFSTVVAPTATLQNSLNTAALTVGFRF